MTSPRTSGGAIEFGAYTGWRVRSEVLPLTWDRVDLERGVIRWEVGTTKNKAGRVLVLRTLPALKALLGRWREITDATEARLHRRVPWVFHRDGRPILKKRFYKVWHDACAKAEVLDAIPHDLRRAAVMRFERDGVPRKAAMSITGHKTESIYGRYNIIDEAVQEEALAKVKLPTFLAVGEARRARQNRRALCSLAPSGKVIDPICCSSDRLGRTSFPWRARAVEAPPAPT